MLDLREFFEGMSKSMLREVHAHAYGKKGLLNNALIQAEVQDYFSDCDRVSSIFSKMEPWQRRCQNLIYHSGNRGLSFNELRLTVPVSKSNDLQTFLLSMCREYILWRSFVSGTAIYLGFKNFVSCFEIAPEENVDVDKRYEGFTGSDGETKNYYFEQSIYGNSTYQILFFDGDGDCIGRYGGYSCDKYFDGSLDAYFQNIHVYANETFQVHYTVYSELGRSGKVELTGDQLFSATSEEINVRRGGVYHGYFEFTAPSVSKRQGKMQYTVQLRDKKSGKMLHYPMTIVVYHKPVETNTDQ